MKLKALLMPLLLCGLFLGACSNGSDEAHEGDTTAMPAATPAPETTPATPAATPADTTHSDSAAGDTTKH